MLKPNKAVPFVLAVSLGGCGGSLSAAGTAVKVMKADPPADCTEVGVVSGHAVGPDHRTKSRNKLRNEAAEKGGNYVRLETVAADGGEMGTAFKCPPG